MGKVHCGGLEVMRSPGAWEVMTSSESSEMLVASLAPQLFELEL